MGVWFQIDGTSAVADPAALWASEIISSGVMEKGVQDLQQLELILEKYLCESDF